MDTMLFAESQRDEWNSFVAGSPNGHILQSWEWGDIKEQSGWQPYRLALGDGERIEAAAQILVRSLPYGLGRLAYIPRGPVVNYRDAGAVQATMEALRRFAAQQRVISLKIEPEVLQAPDVEHRLLAAGLQPAAPVQMRSTIWVDIAPEENTILAVMKQKTRYNIRLAAKKGVTISAGSATDLAGWYRMYETTAQRDVFSIHDRSYYELILRTLEPRGMARLLVARHEGDLLAGIIVFSFGNKAQYMYGASSNEKRNLMAPYLVQWEGMRWARAQGASIYDLWGVPDRLEENEDLWGVYRHKRGYGGEIVRYVGAFDLVRSPLQHLALERLARPIFKRVSRLSL